MAYLENHWRLKLVAISHQNVAYFDFQFGLFGLFPNFPPKMLEFVKNSLFFFACGGQFFLFLSWWEVNSNIQSNHSANMWCRAQYYTYIHTSVENRWFLQVSISICGCKPLQKKLAVDFLRRKRLCSIENGRWQYIYWIPIFISVGCKLIFSLKIIYLSQIWTLGCLILSEKLA